MDTFDYKKTKENNNNNNDDDDDDGSDITFRVVILSVTCSYSRR